MPDPRKIDCLIIGHNKMDFAEYEKTLRQTDIHSGAYRDLNLSFISYDNRPYHAEDVFNLFCRKDERTGELLPPLDLSDTFSAAVAYLGTYLHRHGCTFDFIHSFQDEKEALKEKLEQGNILTIAITTTLYVSSFPIAEIVRFIREYNQTVEIIVGGPFVSTKVRTLEAAELDYIFGAIGADVYVNSSQGEAALVDLIRNFKTGSPLDPVHNIYYKSGGSFKAAPVSIENNPLSENMVDWNLFTRRMGEHVALRTSISCPFSCAFCGFPQHAGKYQTVSVDKIRWELDTLHRIGSVKSIRFIDDTFNVPVKRYKEILRMMIENRYNFKWHSYFRCQFADEEMVEMMKESGCEGVFLGFESGSDRILENMNKSVTVEEYSRGLELLKKYGIVTFANFIVGFPGETRETVEETTRFIRESVPDFYHAQSWYCEPITPIWKQREKYNIQGESFEWSHSTMDSRTACDLVEHVFLNINDSIWVPQYNFCLDSILALIHRGMPMEAVKRFMRAFNAGIEAKLRDPLQRELSFQVIKQLKNFRDENPDAGNGENTFGDSGDAIDRSAAEFVF